MTRTQSQIIDLISQLPVAERRKLFEHIEAAGLLKETFYDRMTPEQHAQLDEGIAQADREQVVDGNAAFDRLAERFAFRRT
jgi:hypothetical protein